LEPRGERLCVHGGGGGKKRIGAGEGGPGNEGHYYLRHKKPGGAIAMIFGKRGWTDKKIIGTTLLKFGGEDGLKALFGAEGGGG